jgi:hypothetical protein
VVFQKRLAAEVIDRFVTGGGKEPGNGIGRRAVARPLHVRGGEGLLQRILGEREIAKCTDEAREDAAVIFAIECFESRNGDRWDKWDE